MRNQIGSIRPMITALGVAGVMMASTLSSQAHPGGGGMGGGFGGGMGGQVHGGGGFGSGFGAGGMSGTHGNFGGQSGAHISSRGLANTNGPNASDRDFGRDRAADRMSARGLQHSQAGLNTHARTKTAAHAGSSERVANSNGLNARDRDFGRDRASDRMSAQGLDHSQAQTTASTSGY